jgi:hypothetical protein
MTVLLCAFLLLATLVTVGVKARMPVAANTGPVSFDGLNMAIKAKEYPGLATKKYPGLATSFEFESPWDKGALWD